MTNIVTTEYTIDKIAAPNLPLAPDQWDRRYQDQLSNVLRLYFNRIDDFIARLNTASNTSALQVPYGAFSDFTNQTAVANTATLMPLSVTDFSSDVSLNTGSRITVTNAGIYNLQFSVQVQNLDNAPEDMFIWLKQNGTDIAGGGIVRERSLSRGGTPGGFWGLRLCQ